jgi:hypothetical protein
MMRHSCGYQHAFTDVVRDPASTNFMFDLPANKQKHFFAVRVKVALRLHFRVNHESRNGRPFGT